MAVWEFKNSAASLISFADSTSALADIILAYADLYSVAADDKASYKSLVS
jgi:hypothetical protein